MTRPTQRAGSASGRFSWFRTLGFGSLAASSGGLFYWAVLRWSGYEVGILALAVGFWVGLGVRWGAQNRRGLAPQLLAMGLTYLAIVATYAPDVARELRRDAPPVAPQDASDDGELRSIVERSQPRRVAAVESTPRGPIRATLVFLGLVLSVPMLAVGSGDFGGAIFLILGLLQAAILNRAGPTRRASR